MSDKKYQNFIGGKWVESKSSEFFLSRNPADREDVIGRFPRSNATDIDFAVQTARKAFAKWRLTPPPARGLILQKAEQLLIAAKDELAKLATREMGKIVMETRGDVQEAIDTAMYMAGEGRRWFGQTTHSELPNKFAMSTRMPLGVAGVISPWNFPVAIPAWKIFPALICGNAVVFKPSSDAPATAARFVEILMEAGIPDGVVNLVFGSGNEAGMALVEHADVNVISFTGSSKTGSHIGEKCGRTHKRLSLEMGGKNGQIVMDDANLELAIEGALWGAFGTTGQRCTATSRLIVHRKVLGEFSSALVERAQKIRIGSGLDATTEMGPLINERQLDSVAQMVKVGKEEDRARLLCGGEAYTEGAAAKGYFFKPTVFTDCHSKMRICQEEIFGPVVSIIPVDS